MKLFKKAKRGFTLVELVVVIAVIAILAAVSVGAYFGITESANSSRLEQEAKAAHTNIQLVAMNQDDNSNLTREGLYINDLDTFETKMESYSGFHYDIVAQEPSAVNNPTLYFCNETGVSSANIVNQRFNTFKYYNPEVGNKRASVNIPSGDITIEEATFELGDPEPIIITSIGFADIPDTVDNFFVGDRKTFNVVTEPAGLGYTFEIEHENVIKIEGNEIVAIGAGTSKVTVKSENKDSNGNQLTDKITVNVTAVEIVELIINGFETTYKENVEFDLSDVTYQLKFNNSDTVLVDVPSSDVTASATKAALGMTSVTFTYSGTHGTKNKTVDILVEPRKLDSISCNISSTETQYIATDVIDLTGFEFKAHYDNGEVENISHQDLEYTSELTAGQGSIIFKYPKTGENQKSITIDFVQPVVDIQITHIEVIGEVKTIWNINDDVTKDGLTFKAIKNKGEPIDITSEVVAEPAKITAETEQIRYSYFDSSSNKTFYTEYVTIEKTDFKKIYFEDRAWWHKDGALPFIQFSSSENTALTAIELTESDILATKVEGSEVGSSTASISFSDDNGIKSYGSSIWEFEVDYLKFKSFKIYRVNKDAKNLIADNNTENLYWDSCLKTINVKDVLTNNLIVLDNNPVYNKTSYNKDNPTYTLKTYSQPFYANAYLEGNFNNWDYSTTENPENYKFEWNENQFVLENVNLKLWDEFKIRFPEYDYNGYKRLIGFDNLTSFKVSLSEGVTGDLEAIKGSINSSSEYSNIAIGYEARGIYTIKIDLEKNVEMIYLGQTEPVEIDTGIEILGNFNGLNWDKGTQLKTTDGQYIYYDLTISRNEEFKFKKLDSEGNDVWFNPNIVNASDFFENYNNNIRCKVYGGTFKLKLDILRLNELDVVLYVDNYENEFTNYILLDVENWKNNDERYCAYFFENDEVKWVNCEHVTGTIYKAEVVTNFTNVIFVRMNGGAADNNWSNKWNQTGNLKVPTDSKNLFVITQRDEQTSGWTYY